MNTNILFTHDQYQYQSNRGLTLLMTQTIILVVPNFSFKIFFLYEAYTILTSLTVLFLSLFITKIFNKF